MRSALTPYLFKPAIKTFWFDAGIKMFVFIDIVILNLTLLKVIVVYWLSFRCLKATRLSFVF